MTDRPADRSDDFFPPFAPARPSRPSDRDAGADDGDASGAFPPFAPAVRRPAAEPRADASAAPPAPAEPEPAPAAGAMPWETAPASEETVVDAGAEGPPPLPAEEGHGAGEEDAGGAYDLPWLEVPSEAAAEVGEGAAAVSPLGDEEAGTEEVAADEAGAGPMPWDDFGAGVGEAAASEETASPPEAVESYGWSEPAAEEAEEDEMEGAVESYGRVEPSTEEGAARETAGEEPAPWESAEAVEGVGIEGEDEEEAGVSTDDLGLVPVGEFGAGEAEQPPVAYAPPVREDEAEPPIGTVSGPDDVIAARLCEVADRLEGIAGTLRDRSPAEVLGGAAGDDPLGLLVTGFVLGYLQRGES